MGALRTSENAPPRRAPQRRALVVVYIVAIAALGAAIYERFFMA